MTRDSDDDGLNWGDESDPTHVDARVDAVPRVTAAERRARAAASVASGGPATSGGSATAAPAGAAASALLVTLGVLAGVYLLYTVGWVITAQRVSVVPADAFDVVMARLRDGLAIAAPAVWFVTSLLLTRHRKPAVRLLWLAVGVVVLVPLPFVAGI